MDSRDLSDARVIIVEDNPSNLMAIMKLLRMAGIERINWRTTGRQVVEFIAAVTQAGTQAPPHLILLDIALPGEDGYAVLAELRTQAYLAQTRIVAVSAFHMPEDLQHVHQAGFDGFIGKPLNPTRFPDQIRRILLGAEVWEPE